MLFSEKEILNCNRDVPNCVKCKLDKTCKSPMMGVTGEGKKGILFIAEAPGKNEDEKGVQLIGEAGNFLREILGKYKFDLERDAWKINAINCRPPKNRKPTKQEIAYCKPYVDKVIADLKPKAIVVLGNVGLESILMKEFSSKGITRFRGHIIPDRKYNAYVCPTFHPSYLIRNPNDKYLHSVYERDIKNILIHDFDKPFPELPFKSVVLTDYKDVFNLLTDVLEVSPDRLYFDYETTGLKPFRKGHKIASISFCYDGQKAYAFPFQNDSVFSSQEIIELEHLWRKVLQNRKIKKCAHNIKFEDTWSRVILGAITNWEYDTILAAHVLDSRNKQTGLKFQTYINFGYRPYDESVNEFLKASNSHNFNKIFSAPIYDLLKYNCLDSAYGYYLMLKQEKEMTPKLKKAYKFLLQGNLALCDIQMNGFTVDEDFYEEKDLELKTKIEELKNSLENSRDAKRFQRVFDRDINIDSTKDIGLLIYEVLKHPPQYTDKGNYIADKETLDEIHIPFVASLLEMRKLQKIKSTYLGQFKREVCNGLIHPVYSLNTVKTYRSSCSNPNLQNVPVRDEYAKNICRGGLLPSKGNILLECDYSGIEVGISACYHKDPQMIKYITDPTTDMHRDSAMDIWILNKEQITKEIRFFAKNCWVFPQFYGSWYLECAKNLWSNCINLKTTEDVTLQDHLQVYGVKTLDQFTDHCKKIENIFWNERFKVYNQWKIKKQEFFIKNGYVDTFLGFKCSGVLAKNDVGNHQIQGTAFHCLLWSLTNINDHFNKNNFKSKIIGQVHDSIIIDCCPSELNKVKETVKRIGTVELRKQFKWITVPMEIDFEQTEVDEPWSKKKEA